MSVHVPLLRRRREGVTDYRSRKRAITSHKALLVVRVSNKNVHAQFVTPSVKGDVVLAAAHSRELLKAGWRGSLKSTPACYLLGMLAGKKALKNGVKDAVLYSGLSPFVRGGRVGAFVKGVVEAGVTVPMGDDALPSDDRVSGKAISDYAAKLSSASKEQYSRSFSRLLKEGFKPEEYPAQVEKVRAHIAGASKK